MGQGASACFGGGMSEEKREQERIASQEARAKAAEAAQRRQLTPFLFLAAETEHFLIFSTHNVVKLTWMTPTPESRCKATLKQTSRDTLAVHLQFEQSAVGRAALAQAAKEKQSTSNSGEPNLKATFLFEKFSVNTLERQFCSRHFLNISLPSGLPETPLKPAQAILKDEFFDTRALIPHQLVSQASIWKSSIACEGAISASACA
ncbi:hypothetical protein Cgig2_023928 [Carnegiea gigantea]|uniref:Uncharacterized protein n=1 Tax=Carnegiea gigantea TaxID=171969 RepID=A0A9Q1GMS8_9CARY|nr:hypothetical protein Cgig2_023928 [Carnegiea gigantea]